MSRIPIVLMAAMLPFAAWGRDTKAERPLWRSAQQTARLGDVSRSEVTILRPADNQVEVESATRPRVWRAASQETQVKRSSHLLSGLTRLFGRSDRRESTRETMVVKPAAEARLQKKGRLP